MKYKRLFEPNDASVVRFRHEEKSAEYEQSQRKLNLNFSPGVKQLIKLMNRL
mgnify:CR=1 FL=1